MTRIFDAYGRSNELTNHIQTALGRLSAGADLPATVAALTGPAGPALIRHQASTTYIVTVITANPNGPKIGGPESNAQIAELTKRFNERIGATLPPDDGSHVKELEAIITGPVREVLRQLWDFAIANSTRQLNTALNLMMLDDHAAIERDIAYSVQ